MPSGSRNVSTLSPKRFSSACVHALLQQAVRPVAERRRRNAERGLLRLADAERALCGVLPWEERQHRAGLALLVAIIEVIGAGIVEIDGLLDEPQAERAGVEVEIAVGRPAMAVTWWMPDMRASLKP